MGAQCTKTNFTMCTFAKEEKVLGNKHWVEKGKNIYEFELPCTHRRTRRCVADKNLIKISPFLRRALFNSTLFQFGEWLINCTQWTDAAWAGRTNNGAFEGNINTCSEWVSSAQNISNWFSDLTKHTKLIFDGEGVWKCAFWQVGGNTIIQFTSYTSTELETLLENVFKV